MNTLERILSIAKENKINQANLADNLCKMVSFKITKQTITDWKGGKSSSYYFCIPEIASLLNVSCDYLLTGEERTIKLSKDEREILENYRNCSEEGKRCIANVAKMAQYEYKKDTVLPDTAQTAG